VPTGFFSHAGMPGDYFPRFLARTADQVARDGYAGFMGGHRIVVPGAANRITTLLPRLSPRALVLAIMNWHWKRSVRGR
jgi:short-subunit dehydrogenase